MAAADSRRALSVHRQPEPGEEPERARRAARFRCVRAAVPLRALSDRDELTGLYNLRAFSRLAEHEHDAANRAGRSYSVLMVDIEHLKELNDTYGHDAGNRAVKLVADALTRLTRSTDLVARYGGDEFVLLLSSADKVVAEEVAQRIRNVVFSTTLEVDVKMVRI